MPITDIQFNEPIYTRKDKFNHIYDITLNEIQANSDKKGFSDYGYCYSLIKRITDYSYHENFLFIRYQLTASLDPLRWLLDFEKLIELNSWKSSHGFYNVFEELHKKTKDVFSKMFTAIEAGDYNQHETNSNIEDVILNTEEACAFLNISKSTIYKLTSSNNIPFYKPNGKNMYFRKIELSEYLLHKKQLSVNEVEAEAINYLTRNKNH